MIVAILVFGLIVFFHELGHFSVAKFVGIKVHEFAIGMGPRLFKYTRGETDYSIRLLPLGGYVKMEGEDEVSDDKRSFSKKSVGERIAVVFAGAFMNFVLALILFTIVFYNLTGIPTTTIDEIIENSPAESVGIRENDQIIGVNDIEIEDWDQLLNIINNSQGEELKLTLLRNNASLDKTVIPRLNESDNRYVIGIIPHTNKSFPMALQGGFVQIKTIIVEMFSFFKGLITKQSNGAEIVGPVGIISLFGEASSHGIYNVILLAGLISVNLGFINLLPIPALDGSRILFLLFELIKGSPVNPEREAFIHMVGLALLMLMMIIVTYKDILAFF